MDTLETQRLIIRPFTMDDLATAHELLDRDILWGGPSVSRAERRQRLQFQVGLANWDLTGSIYGHRAILLKESGLMIGFCHLWPELWSPAWKGVFWPALFPGYDHGTMGRDASLEMAVGYALSTRQRGRGYATEAVRTVLEYAFGKLKVARVFATTDRENADSVRLMRRVGMRVAANPDPSCVYPALVGVVESDGSRSCAQ